MVTKVAFAIFLSVCCLASVAQERIIELAPDVPSYDIGTRVSYLEDKTGRLTLKEIQTPEVDSQFIPQMEDVLTAGINKSAFWVKVITRNKDPRQQAVWILTLDYPPLDSIVLYQQDPGGSWEGKISGDRLPFEDRPIPHYKFAFALSMPDTLPHTYYLRVRTAGSILIGPHFETEKYFIVDSQVGSIGYGFFIGALIIMLFYNLFLYFSLRDISYLAYVLFIFNNLVMQLCYSGHISQYVFPNDPDLANQLLPMAVALTPFTAVFFTTSFLNTRHYTPLIHKALLFVGAFAILNFLIALLSTTQIAGLFNSVNISLLLVTSTVAGIANYAKGNKSARFFLLAWSFLIMGGSIVTLRSFGFHFPNFLNRNGSMIGSLIEMVLLSIALADKYNIIKIEKDSAQREVIRLNENAKRVLEQKVEERTAELNQSLVTLKNTQAQLVQKEKLASLGELTAGIAHEIQNPLNLANNFSEVSEELTEDLRKELEKGSLDEAKLISEDLIQNLKRINHHGKRASGIVRGMLEHAQGGTGVRQETDVNELVSEYVRIFTNKMKSANPEFHGTITTQFGDQLPRISVVRQDIGRVIMNLLDNAWYAAVMANDPSSGRKPTVTVSTHVNGNNVSIIVSDNGAGMSDKVMARVFEPFFTTKPTGQGNTGLGMSLSYDIVTRGHNGTLEARSREGAGATFEITLPV